MMPENEGERTYCEVLMHKPSVVTTPYLDRWHTSCCHACHELRARGLGTRKQSALHGSGRSILRVMAVCPSPQSSNSGMLKVDD